jgi:hypothetical protein
MPLGFGFFSFADLYYDDVMYPHFVKYILGWLDGTRKERLQLAEYVGLIPRIIRREYGKINPDHPIAKANGQIGIEGVSEILHEEFGVDVGFGFPPMYKRVVGRAHPEWYALFMDIVNKRWKIAEELGGKYHLPPHGDMADDRIRELVAQRKQELGVETIVVPVEEVLYNNAKFLKLSEKAKEYFEKRMKELWG